MTDPDRRQLEHGACQADHVVGGAAGHPQLAIGLDLRSVPNQLVDLSTMVCG